MADEAHDPSRGARADGDALPAAPAATGEAPAGPTPRMVQRELRDLMRSHEQRRRQLPRALVVGLVSGLFAVSFKWALDAGDALRAALAAFSSRNPVLGLVLFVALGATGAASSVYLVQRFAPDAAGSGIPHVKAVLHHLRELGWKSILLVKFLGGVLGIGGAGLALGREGPTIQMGSAVGQMVSGWFRCTPRERQTLIAAGAGAGLSAAFNAPLAGLVFVLEELQRDFAPAVFTVTLIASVTADVTARYLTSELPVFHIGKQPIASLTALPLALAIGIIAALVGIAFNRSLVATLDLFQRLRLPPWGRGAVAGAIVGAIGWFLPSALAGGHALVERTLAGLLAPAALVGFFTLRFALTMASYGSGAPGGIFAPMLVLGAALGMALAEAARAVWPELVTHPESFAVVGMAALFTAVVRAPLTGIVLMVEMTGDYGLVLPLLVAALTSGGLADYLGDRPIYDVLLRRDMRRWQSPQLGEALLLDLTIAPAARFDGRALRELGLPRGCLVVSVERGPHTHVPTADFRLEAGDRMTVVVGPEAAAAVTALRDGTEGAHG
jgi:CIC family chloride channel protein